MDGVSNSVTVIDKNYNVTMMNKLAQESTGYTLNSYEKKKCYKLYHNLDAPCNSDALKCPHSEIIYGENELYVTASIGISLYPDDGEETDLLLRNADSAMYQAKDQGRNNYQFYTQEMTEQAFERMLLEKNLRRAIKDDEFIIYYQPQYNSRTQKITGMEALFKVAAPGNGLSVSC